MSKIKVGLVGTGFVADLPRLVDKPIDLWRGG